MKNQSPAPGPYEVQIVIDEEGKARGSKGERWILIKNDDGAIATVYPAHNGEATAQLLAASYQMFGALESIRSLIEGSRTKAEIASIVGELHELADLGIYAATRGPQSVIPGRTDQGP